MRKFSSLMTKTVIAFIFVGGVALLPGCLDAAYEAGIDDTDNVKFVREGQALVAWAQKKRYPGLGYRYGDPAAGGFVIDGAYLLDTADRLAVAYLDDASGGRRRYNVAVLDARPSSSTYRQVVANHRGAYTGSAGMHGLSGTSFYTAQNKIGGLFTFVETEPKRVMLAEVAANGLSTIGPFALNDVRSTVLDTAVAPAIEYGQNGASRKILVAYAWQNGANAGVDVGFVTKNWFGSWSFARTATIFGRHRPGVSCSKLYQKVDVAFDANRNEFGVAFVCGAFSTELVRVSWWGTPLSSVPFVAHKGLEGAHTGASLAFNRLTDSYLVAGQHNGSIAWPSGNTFACDIDPDVGCVDTFPGGCIVRDGGAALAVDYWAGFEFRMAGQCMDTGQCVPKEGVSFELRVGSIGTRCADLEHWWREAGQLYPVSTHTIISHNYVRIPGVGRAFELHIEENTNSMWGRISVSTVDEPVTQDWFE